MKAAREELMKQPKETFVEMALAQGGGGGTELLKEFEEASDDDL